MPPPFDPTTLFLYFDAADPSTLKGSGGSAITDGAEVYEWQSSGTSSAKFIPISGASRPTWHASGPGGKPALRFNGAHGLTLDSLSGFASLSSLLIGVVGSLDSTPPTGQQALFKIHANMFPQGSRAILAIFEGRIRTGGRRLDTNSGQWWQDGPVAPNERFIATTAYDYANAKMDSYKNGIWWIEDTFQTSGTSAASNPLHVSIGLEQRPADGWATNYMTGWIEAVVCNPIAASADMPAPSPADLVPLHHYLRIAKEIG